MFSSNQTSAKTSTNVIKHHGVTSKSKGAGTSDKLKLTITPSGISLAILKDLSPGCSARQISYYSLLTTYYLLLTTYAVPQTADRAVPQTADVCALLQPSLRPHGPEPGLFNLELPRTAKGLTLLQLLLFPRCCR